MSGVALAPAHTLEEWGGLLTCVHCGLCLPACPTYQVLGEENDSPRGRLHLIRVRMEGREVGESARRRHLGACLGCRACETVCPAGVPYGALLEQERERLLEPRPVRAWLGRLTLGSLTGRGVGRLLYTALRMIRGAGVARWAAGLFPGRIGLAARLLDATRPGPRSRRTGASGRPGSRTARSGRPTARPGRPAARAAAGPAPSASYTLLEGCVMRGLFRHVHESSRRALDASGCREIRAPRQGCCGALHAHAGHMERARELARRNIAAFEGAGDGYIVVDAAGCGAALREYPAWLADDPGWARAAERLATRVRDVMELLAEMSRTSAAPRPAAPRTTPPSGSRSPRIAYDAPCHLLHAQRVDSAPRTAVRSMTGVEMEPLPSSSDCCGGAGLYNLFHTALSGRILERKVEEIRAGGYDAVATGNPGCIMQIGAGLRAAGLKIPVVHPVELLDPETPPADEV